MNIKELISKAEQTTGYTVDDVERSAKETTLWNNEVGVIAIFNRNSGKLTFTQRKDN